VSARDDRHSRIKSKHARAGRTALLVGTASHKVSRYNQDRRTTPSVPSCGCRRRSARNQIKESQRTHRSHIDANVESTFTPRGRSAEIRRIKSARPNLRTRHCSFRARLRSTVITLVYPIGRTGGAANPSRTFVHRLDRPAVPQQSDTQFEIVAFIRRGHLTSPDSAALFRAFVSKTSTFNTARSNRVFAPTIP